MWAVGYYGPTNPPYGYRTLVEHWNGATWSIVPSPNQGQNGNQLTGVAVSSNNVWAVGVYNYGSEQLIEHWDGSVWNTVQAPSPGPAGSALTGIAAASSTTVWAVGYFGSSSGSLQTLVERLNQCPGAHTPTPGVPPTNTPTSTSTPTLVPPPCPGERFTDVRPGDYFYTSILALADDGILSGYNTSPPCRNDLWIPCFNPYSSSTRGQISKVVSLAAGFSEPVSGQTFEDVPPGSTFYTYTERMAERNIINGYTCGGPGEPCVPPDDRPYFRTNNHVTRGQLSKMVSLAFGWNDPPASQDFEDIPPGSTFYTFVAQLYNRSIIVGYPCGGSSEPCIPPDNRPYFRPNNNVIRGQTAKIVQLARTQPTPTPTPTATTEATATLTEVATTTGTAVPTSTPLVPTDTPAPTITSTTVVKSAAPSTAR